MSHATHGLERPAPRPIPGGPLTIPELIDRAADERPDQEALVGRLNRHSYREVQALMEAGAAALYGLGVRPGDRVACAAPNQVDIMIAYLAVQRLGAVWVGISRQLAGPELAFQLQDAGARLFLGDAATLDKLACAGEATAAIERTVDMEPGDNEWCRLIAAHRGQRAPGVEIDPLAPAGIAYTSGTTGHPKGAVHSQHGILVMAVHAARRSLTKGPAFRKGATLPMTILNVIAKDALAALAGGGTFVIVDRLDAPGVAEWIERERLESIVCSPPTIGDFIRRDEITPAALETMKALTCGGGACPPQLRDGYMAKFGKPLYVSWGLTEAPTAVAGGFTDQCPAAASGRVFDHLEVVVRTPNGAQAAPGQEGELCVRAASAGKWADVYVPMLGYWNRPQQTAETLQGGELHTGDIGYLDAAGWLYIVDRAKSVIIRGGQNIYPAEIERVLKTHPEVLDAALLAVPSARFGESALAAIEVASEAIDRDRLQAELQAICLRELARFKCPETWLFLTDFARNAMMKINRGALRDRCLAVLAQAPARVTQEETSA
jgi:long-chain acyl-CoA synthetase